MPAIAAFTPDVHAVYAAITNRTYNPASIDQGIAKWAESGVSLDARAVISSSVRLPKAGGSVARVTVKAVIPVMAGTTPDVKVGEGIATAEFVIPKVMTINQRKELLATLYATIMTSQLGPAVTDLESAY